MLLKVATLLSYLLTLFCLIQYIRPKKTKSNKKNNALTIIYFILGTSIILHFILLGHQIIEKDQINIGALKALSLTVCLMLSISIFRLHQYINTIIVLTSIALFTVLLSSIIPSNNEVSGNNLMLGIHILVSIAAYAILMLAAFQALFVYLRDYALKKGSRFIPNKFPPLMRMERWLFQLLTVGFVFLTLSIITSFLFIDLWFTKPQIHKTILSLTSWFLFGLLLFFHYRYNLRGVKAARFVLLACGILLLAITGSRLIQELIFHRT